MGRITHLLLDESRQGVRVDRLVDHAAVPLFLQRRVQLVGQSGEVGGGDAVVVSQDVNPPVNVIECWPAPRGDSIAEIENQHFHGVEK